MLSCKNCEDKKIVKNGIVREQQRYKCKSCGYNFVLGDKRIKLDTAVKRAFAVILYALGKSSYGFIAKLFGVTPPVVQKWLKKEAELCWREIDFMELPNSWDGVKNKDGGIVSA